MTHNTADLRLPADSAYVATVRLTTAALATRLGFTIEELEDARIAVSEACALLLEVADADGTLEVHYQLGAGVLGVSVSIEAAARTGVDRGSFGWQVLGAVTMNLRSDLSEGRHRLSYASKSAPRSV